MCASCCVPKFSAKSSARIYLQNLHLLFLTHTHSLTILFMHVRTCVLSGQRSDDYPSSTGCDAEDEGCFRQLFSILCESTEVWGLLCLVGWLEEQGCVQLCCLADVLQPGYCVVLCCTLQLCGLCCTLTRAQFSRLGGRCTFLNLTSGNAFLQFFFFLITSHIYISTFVSFMPIMV